MFLIGLTGGIASGKSTVSHMLSELGAYIVDADKLSREITQPGKPAWEEIIKRFGLRITHVDGKIDRKRLGQLVFADRQARADLEKITHPYIEAAAKDAIAAAAECGFAVVVLDAPLLIEVGWHTKVDAVWVVYVNEQTQLARLMARDKSDEKAARARMNAQLALKNKLKYADVVIDNNDGIENTKKNVCKAWQEIKGIF
ncbi:dephospho-CoA kinase [Sporomusa acidovorans]|uniref:Dephospho-CoA kinase n=1 Tax=Sporomusa acidovorans (strain ATCC 49682 / DSM 3132 / Mol) TaxID=1123286 RepID=A0ABZ3J3W4_SPOA4|nr:dephospho-CoA kinase [Sporomusa acidovorans]OZC13383.1 dephospho-CoA kinase [Sporomusa acidovorans DSM 3132]SDF78685.1 dephospho-CoA kinase [Sporomusa acidovorans]